MRLVLLDAHAILHRAYHALPDFATASGQPTGALYGLSTMVIGIVEQLKPDYVVACYDLAAPTFRHEISKEYKAQRKKTDDNLVAQMDRSRDIFTALNIPIYDKAGFEADDMLGTIVEQVVTKEKGKGKKENSMEDVDIIIASGDMDTLQLVKDKRVQVYTLKKGIKDTIMYDVDAVNARFGFGPKLIPDYKGLRGDPSDNIPGVKGIGEKTATILIKEFGTIENIYKSLKNEGAFLKAGITPRIIQLLRDNEEEALFSKMLATIRRDAPIKFVLPEKKFSEALDIKKINSLWHELEFRTLTTRLENVMKKMAGGAGAHSGKAGVKSDEFFVTSEKSVKPNGATTRDVVGIAGQGSLLGANISPLELEKTAIALWLVNSNVTQPQLEDILSFANVQESEDNAFEIAKTAIFAELEKRGVKKVYEDIELPLMPVIVKMRERGVKIDRKILSNLAKTYHEEVASLEQKIWKFAGKEFNISSPKQLGDILFDTLGLKPKNAKKTGSGARSTKESELEKMRDMHPMVPLIFQYRELTKLLGTYIDAIPPLLDNEDRLHAKFIQTGTTTGRMGCQDPNLQNIPIKTELGRAIRTAFVAEKGFKLCAFDYSQIELRIAAFLSGDESMIDIFRSGEDFHRSVASRVFGVSPDEVTPQMRGHAKTINFGIIYGMGVSALKQNIGTTREEAQRFYDDYFKAFPTLAAYLDGVKAETARKGYTETFFGRRRYFEGIRSKLPFIRAAAERMAINAPIQGTEADIIKLAMIKIDEFVKKEGLEKDVYPTIQVHDELVYEIRAERAVEIAEDIKEIMQSVVRPDQIKGIVMVADAHIGNNWGELK